MILQVIVVVLVIILILWGIGGIAKIITKPGPPVQIISGDFNTQQLNQFDGQKKPQNFMALKGVIYDVSESWFYRKKGPYGKFAGHDASINLAKMSHDDNMLDQWGKMTLTNQQDKVLQDWIVKLSKKYRKVGVVLQN